MRVNQCSCIPTEVTKQFRIIFDTGTGERSFIIGAEQAALQCCIVSLDFAGCLRLPDSFLEIIRKLTEDFLKKQQQLVFLLTDFRT